MPAKSTIRPIPVFVLKVVQWAELGCGADFILRLGTDNCCRTRRKNIEIGQRLPKLQQM